MKGYLIVLKTNSLRRKKLQLIDEDAVGADEDEFDITTVEEAIKKIVGFANYNAV